MKNTAWPLANRFDVWHLDEEQAVRPKPFVNVTQCIARVFQVFHDMKHRDQIVSTGFDARVLIKRVADGQP